jgi:hypothetical protein
MWSISNWRIGRWILHSESQDKWHCIIENSLVWKCASEVTPLNLIQMDDVTSPIGDSCNCCPE